MPGKLNVNGGTPSTAVGVLANIGGAWHTVTQGFVNVAGTWHQWFKASVLDSFNRTTSGSLGIADSGQAWNATRGTWFANGSQAQSNDAASNYSIATIDTGSVSNVQTIGNTTNGTGAALWVTDSGDWFGVAAGQEVVNTVYYYTCGCTTCSGSSCTCQSCSTVYYGCGTTGASYYAGSYTPGQEYSYYVCAVYYSLGACRTYQIQYGTYASSYTPPSYYAGTYSCAGSYQSCSPSCCSYYSYTCGCTTCQGGSVSYPAYLYMYQSVANTVTQVVRSALSTVAASLKVITSGGNTITATPYSDSLVTPIGSPVTYTASSTQTGTQFGILLSPSAYNQGSVLDNYQSQNN